MSESKGPGMPATSARSGTTDRRTDGGDAPRERRRERPRGERDPDVRHAAEAAASGRVWNRSRTDRRRSPADVRGADVGEARDGWFCLRTVVNLLSMGYAEQALATGRAALRSPGASGEGEREHLRDAIRNAYVEYLGAGPASPMFISTKDFAALNGMASHIASRLGRSPEDVESARCRCEWLHPVDGSVDARWPAELDPACPVHASGDVRGADVGALIREASEFDHGYLRDGIPSGTLNDHITKAHRLIGLLVAALRSPEPAAGPNEAVAGDGLTFDALRAANIARLPEFKNKHGEPAHSEPDGSDWSPAQWLQAVVGELGEYANLRKKFERGDIDGAEFQREAADELADVQCYLDILAFQLRIDLGAATADKWNRISERVGYVGRLPEPSAEPATGRDRSQGVTEQEVPSAGGEPRYTLDEVADMMDGESRRIGRLRSVVDTGGAWPLEGHLHEAARRLRSGGATTDTGKTE